MAIPRPIKPNKPALPPYNLGAFTSDIKMLDSYLGDNTKMKTFAHDIQVILTRLSTVSKQPQNYPMLTLSPQAKSDLSKLVAIPFSQQTVKALKNQVGVLIQDLNSKAA